MIFIYIGMILLAIGAGSIIGWRLYREYLLRKVEKQLSSDALAKRKLRLFKHNLRSGHLLIVLGCSSSGSTRSRGKRIKSFASRSE